MTSISDRNHIDQNEYTSLSIFLFFVDFAFYRVERWDYGGFALFIELDLDDGVTEGLYSL